MNIFISYRRDDSIIHARLIHNELVARFGAEAVFMDIEDIAYGADFERAIDARIAAADVVIAVIGPQWAPALQERAHGEDYVRYELARALECGRRVVPVLVGGAPPPGLDLPPTLHALRTLNCLKLDERALKPHLNALVETVQGRSFEDVALDLRRHIRSVRRAHLSGVSVGLATFFAAWVALLDYAGVDTRLASATMWLGALGASAPWSGEVVLVAIDETSVAQVGRPFDASWRREHAQLIDRLARAGARAIAFDLFFERPGDARDDAALESAIKAARPSTVAFAVQAMDGDRPRLLQRFAGVAAAGIACAGQKLGLARSLPLAVERGELRFPSLALAAFSGGGRIESVDAETRELRVRLPREERSPDVRFSFSESVRTAQPGCEAIRRGDRVALQLFDPAGQPALREPPRRVPYERVLRATAASELAFAKGKIVLVGLALAGRDVMTIASGPSGSERFGVELIAEQIDALVRDAAIRPTGAWGDLLTMLSLGLAGAFAQRWAASKRKRVRWLLVLCGCLACVAAAAAIYRAHHVLINLPYALCAFAMAWWALAWLEKRSAS